MFQKTHAHTTIERIEEIMIEIPVIAEEHEEVPTGISHPKHVKIQRLVSETPLNPPVAHVGSPTDVWDVQDEKDELLGGEEKERERPENRAPRFHEDRIAPTIDCPEEHGHA